MVSEGSYILDTLTWITLVTSLPPGWSPNLAIDPLVHWLYMVEMGFYLHCCYATVYIETIRRDFTIMMAHHVVTLGLLLFSYIVRSV